MCGIVGAFTSAPKLYKNPVTNYFRQALFADALRGWDSTGIAVMDDKMSKPYTYKRALASPDYLQLKQARVLLADNAGWTFMLGHNRAATKGGIGDEQAHPFQFGNITMVHNGTVTNHRTLPEGHKFDVDSEAIAYTINTHGIAEVVKKIDGAFTLVWHDALDDSLNFIRNEERPLWVGIVDDDKTLLMASEGEMLRWLASRPGNGMKVKTLFQPNVGRHYKYYIGGEKWTTNPITQDLELAPKYPISTYGAGYQNTGAGTNRVLPTKNRILRSLGLEPVTSGVDIIPFRVSKWQPQMANMQIGTLHGKVFGAGNTLHEVRIPSVSKSRADELVGKVVRSELESAYYPGGDETMAVLNVSPSIKKLTVLTDAEVDELKAKKRQGGDSQKKNEKSSDSKKLNDNGNNNQKSTESEGEEEPPAAETYEGHMGKHYTKKDMLHLLKDGCACCSCDLNIDEVDLISWVDFQSPVCSECWSETVN